MARRHHDRTRGAEAAVDAAGGILTPPARPPGDRLLFVFRSGWEERRRAVEQGLAPAEAHGIFALRRRGIDAEAVDDSLAVSLVRRAASIAYQRLYVIPRSGLGYRLHQAAAVRRLLRSDPDRVVVATTDSIALPLLALRRSGSLPNPVVYLSIGFVDRLIRGDVHPRLGRRYAQLAACATRVFAFAPREVARLQEWVGDRRARLMPLGVDADWWSCDAPPSFAPFDVLAFGRDDSRDFVSLDAALRGMSVDAHVVGTLARRQGLRPRPGLTLSDDVPIDALREMIRSARVVVVPARPAAHGAGQTSALHAMAAARPVVMSDTGWAGAAGLRPGVHYAAVPPSDPDALASVLRDLLAAPSDADAMGRRAREHIRTHLSPEAQADALLQSLTDDEQATGDAPV